MGGISGRAAAIVPAYNEEPTIGGVVRALSSCELIDEVIVIDDGSQDATAQIASAAGARIVPTPRVGKGAAMRAGALSTDADIVVFFDGDESGVSPQHVRALLEPIFLGRADMVVGVRHRSRWLDWPMLHVLPLIAGERALSRSVFLAAGKSTTDFGIEVALNRYAQRNRLRVLTVVLYGITHRTKEQKLGYVRGVGARLSMIMQVMRAHFF